jgi:hypothetical protein
MNRNQNEFFQKKRNSQDKIMNFLNSIKDLSFEERERRVELFFITLNAAQVGDILDFFNKNNRKISVKCGLFVNNKTLDCEYDPKNENPDQYLKRLETQFIYHAVNYIMCGEDKKVKTILNKKM